jgi:hypothetical protein
MGDEAIRPVSGRPGGNAGNHQWQIDSTVRHCRGQLTPVEELIRFSVIAPKLPFEEKSAKIAYLK